MGDDFLRPEGDEPARGYWVPQGEPPVPEALGGVVPGSAVPVPEAPAWTTGPVLMPLEALPSPRRRRTGLWIGVGLGGAALVAGAVVGWLVVGAKLFPARSPEAAVARFVDGLAAKDGLAMYGVLSPAEVALVRHGLVGLDDEVVATPDPTSAEQWEGILDALTITVEGLELETTTLDDGLARVAITGGAITVDGDPEAIADSLLDAIERGSEVTGQPVPTDLISDETRDEIVADLEEWLPYTAHPADEWEVDGDEPFLVAVHEGRGWYVSPLMTLGEYVLVASGSEAQRGEMPDEVSGADDPQAAGEMGVQAIADLVMGDPDTLKAALPLAERRLFSVYIEPVYEDSWPENFGVDWVGVDSAEFEVLTSDEDSAELGVTDLALAIEAEGETGSVTFDGDCVSMSGPPEAGSTEPFCYSDVPAYGELGLSQPVLVAVREDGSWHVSLIATLVDQAVRMAQSLEQLVADGEALDENWWAEQLGPLAGATDPYVTDPYATPMYYGDDPYLDELASACLDGDPAACDALYDEAPYGPNGDPSEYQVIAATCGYRADVSLFGTCSQ